MNDYILILIGITAAALLMKMYLDFQDRKHAK